MASLYKKDLKIPIYTNNGVERQNRVLIDGYTKLRTHKSLSGLITILHRDFLPAKLGGYKEVNCQSSEMYRKYHEHIPEFLRNRPRKVVKHCLKRIANSHDFPASAIEKKEGKYFVKSSSTDVHEVEFGDYSTSSRCDCHDFTITGLPCKHTFAIFSQCVGCSWDSLPKWYRHSDFLTLDPAVVDTISCNGTHRLSEAQENNKHCTTEQVVQKSMQKEGVHSEELMADEGQSKPSKSCIQRVSAVLSELKDILFSVTSQNAVNQAEAKLNEVRSELLKWCPHDQGLRLEPDLVSLKVKRKRPAPATDVYDKLPRKYPKPNPYTSRHGAVASKMRPLHRVVSLHPANERNPEENHEKVDIRDSSDKLPTASTREVKKTAAKIVPVPCITYANQLTAVLLKNGPYGLSLLHLKSLEPQLNNNERKAMNISDPLFKEGWVYDQVIDSFMWQLCSENCNVLYADSAVAQVMERKGSIKKLWSNINLLDKKYIFIPWNSSKSHWVLLVVDISTKVLMYLDPLQMVLVQTNVLVAKAKSFVNHVMLHKIQSQLTSVDVSCRSNRVLQSDDTGCGAYICMYAYWLKNGMSLVQKPNAIGYRRKIYSVVAGNCLPSTQDKNVCKRCQNNFCRQSTALTGKTVDRIECTRCNQWFHCTCVGKTREEAEPDDRFVCP